MRVSFLGPAGTFSEEALLLAAAGAEIEPLPAPTIHDAVLAVGTGRAEVGFVPFENSIEGSVRPTLDALAFDAPGVEVVGEYDHPIHAALIAGAALPLGEIEVVVSHPQAAAQCARFLREELPDAEVRALASTADAVMQVAGGRRPWAALGSAAAARRYGCTVLADSVEDLEGNVTRFVWLRSAAESGVSGAAEPLAGAWRTTIVFQELGEDHPGALVEALEAFSSRSVNLTRIESRPRREGLGSYLFFLDVEGPVADPRVAGSIEALRGKAETVRVLGSYRLASRPPF